jgi:hypothetical protein
MRGIDASSDWTALLPGFIVAGIGIGIVNPGIGSAAIGVVSAARAGMASGINTTFRQVGIATGVAALGAIFQSRIESELADGLPQAKPGLSDLVASGGSKAAVAVVPPDARAQVAHAATVAFTSALNEILLVGAVIAFIGAVLGFSLTRSEDFVPQGPAEPAPAAA